MLNVKSVFDFKGILCGGHIGRNACYPQNLRKFLKDQIHNQYLDTLRRFDVILWKRSKDIYVKSFLELAVLVSRLTF